MSVYDFETELEELMDQACNELLPQQFEKLLHDLESMIEDFRN